MHSGFWWVARLLCLLALCLALATPAPPATAQGEEGGDERVYTVALYAPDVDFGDSIAKAGFVNQIASALAARTGLKFKGVSFGRSGDFSGSGVDYAIIGGTYYAAAGGGRPVAFASGSGQLAILGRGGPVSALRGKTLILPPPARALEGYVTSALLGNQIEARDFFVIKTTKDVKSAVAAVQVGQADLTVAFDAYAGGLSVLHRSSASPLPVAAQVNQKLDPAVAEKINAAFRGLPVSAGLVTGFGGSGAGISAFKAQAGGGRRLPAPSMATPRPPVLRVPVVQSQGHDRLVPAPAGALIPTPPLPQEHP